MLALWHLIGRSRRGMKSSWSFEIWITGGRKRVRAWRRHLGHGKVPLSRPGVRPSRVPVVVLVLCARRCGSAAPFASTQILPESRMYGLSDQEVGVIRGGGVDGSAPAKPALLRMADAMAHTSSKVSHDFYAELRRYSSEEQLIERQPRLRSKTFERATTVWGK